MNLEQDFCVRYADRLVLSVGPWIKESLPALAKNFVIYRQVLYWFKVKGDIERYLPDQLPVYIFDFGKGEDFYGFPVVDIAESSVKIALEQYMIDTSPDAVDRSVTTQDIQRMFTQAAAYIPDITDESVKTVTCLYTVTPDYHFVIDFYPNDERVIVASPCSGHGFKHSAAIGEVLAELALTGKSTIDIRKFSLKRFD